MRYLYSPQFNPNQTIEYQIGSDKVTATIGDQVDTFDFSNFGEGSASIEEINSSLPINPIMSAIRDTSGELNVVLLYWHGANATHDQLFPTWQEVS